MSCWLVAPLLGALLAHSARRLTPFAIGLPSRPLPFSLPLMEGLGALLAFLAACQEELSPRWLSHACLLFLLLLATGCDYYRKVIPTWICLGGPWFALLFSFWPVTRMPASTLGATPLAQALDLDPQSAFLPALLAVVGWLVGFLTLECFRRIMGKLGGLEVMGMGDSYLLGLIGAFAGPGAVLLTVLPASLLGILHWPYFRWVKGIDHLPFGPALAMGGWLTLFYQHELLGAVERMMEALQHLAGRARLLVFLALLGSLFFLVWRIRRRAADYAASIEADYAQLDDELHRQKARHKARHMAQPREKGQK